MELAGDEVALVTESEAAHQGAMPGLATRILVHDPARRRLGTVEVAEIELPVGL